MADTRELKSGQPPRYSTPFGRPTLHASGGRVLFPVTMRGMISAQGARRAVWRPLWELPRRRDLIWPMARRMTVARYRGAALGLVWPVLTPLVMIAVFTFLFAGVFGARFAGGGGPWGYALYLFCGRLPWTAFQETLQQ